MTTLRDRVRSALGRTAPTEPEARAELDRILARTRPSRRRYQLAAAYGTVAAVLVVLLMLRLRPEPRVDPQPHPDNGAHLYIHVSGEPPESALAIDFTSSPGAR